MESSGVANWLHARFAPEIKAPFLEWIEAHSPRYIVSEEHENRIHHHIAFETALGIESIKKKLQAACKALNLQTERGKANAWYGGVKHCTDTSYICKDGNIIKSKGFMSQTIEDLIAEGKGKYRKELPLVQPPGAPTNTIQIVQPAKKSVSMRAQFVRYMESENDWKKNFSITLDTYINQLDDLSDYLTVFWENAFTTPQGAVCIEHAKWYFADDNVRDVIKCKNRAALKKILRE